MTRTNVLGGVAATLAVATLLVAAGSAFAALPRLTDPIALPSVAIAISSDRCIQLEQQFDAVKGEHATNPHMALAQSYRDKGSYLCNADVDDVGEEQLEKALQLLGVEPDPVP